jgi:hypothetical protein
MKSNCCVKLSTSSQTPYSYSPQSSHRPLLTPADKSGLWLGAISVALGLLIQCL